jgi:ABC-type uncharacterized transport system auxiliary subunit
MKASHIIAVATCIGLGACSIIPDPPPAPRIYPLRADLAAAPANVAPAPIVIGVPEPAVSTVLSGADIVWVRDGVFGFMERANWPSRTPIALQALLIEMIDGQKQVLSAVRSGEGPRADAELRWQVNDFQIEETRSGLVARFTAEVKLMNGRSRVVFAARRFESTQAVAERSGAAAARALALAARIGASEISDWAARTAAADATSSPKPLSSQASAASSKR